MVPVRVKASLGNKAAVAPCTQHGGSRIRSDVLRPKPHIPFAEGYVKRGGAELCLLLDYLLDP
jgi:hypothetical protein